MQLNDRISAVVTGGASGLGEALVRRLAGHGVKVAVFDRDALKGAALSEELGILHLDADVGDEASAEAAFAAARERHGQERIMVNCAGVFAPSRTAGRDAATGRTKRFPMARLMRNLDVNLIGTFLCASISAAGMLELDRLPGDDGERGVILNVSSLSGVEGQIGEAGYGASKGGVLGMTLPMARDLMDDGIRVNAILPGTFLTGMVQLGEGAEDALKRLAGKALFPKRLGRADEFASLAEEVITNPYINAAHFRIDGGARLNPL